MKSFFGDQPAAELMIQEILIIVENTLLDSCCKVLEDLSSQLGVSGRIGHKSRGVASGPLFESNQECVGGPIAYCHGPQFQKENMPEDDAACWSSAGGKTSSYCTLIGARSGRYADATPRQHRQILDSFCINLRSHFVP
jgi:hypothetical protein